MLSSTAVSCSACGVQCCFSFTAVTVSCVRLLHGLLLLLLPPPTHLQVLDPQLHALFEARECLNYFFAFRWLLIHFKREFPFDQVRRYQGLLRCFPGVVLPLGRLQGLRATGPTVQDSEVRGLGPATAGAVELHRALSRFITAAACVQPRDGFLQHEGAACCCAYLHRHAGIVIPGLSSSTVP